MSDADRTVECDHHGPCVATYTCQHLPPGVGCGFCTAEPEPGDPWPDAWCSACEAVRAREGEWNDVSEAFAGVMLLCSGCYESARDRNAGPPEIEGLSAPATASERMEFTGRARKSVQTRNDTADQDFRVFTHERWDFDLAAGTLTFSTEGLPTTIGDVQLIGSLSNNTNTWLWA